eukprot:m.29441 g.29441  ORF g.29441 m.29441 type:complete len:225 (+) comp8102_c0_seq1:156-830(+)
MEPSTDDGFINDDALQQVRLRQRAGSTMLRPQRRSTLAKIANKPMYAPPPPPTPKKVTEEKPPDDSLLYISGGKIVESKNTYEIPDHIRIRILTAVKEKIITPDEAVSLSVSVVNACASGNDAFVEMLMEATKPPDSNVSSPTPLDKTQRRIVMREVAAGTVPTEQGKTPKPGVVQLSPEDLSKLDDLTRIQIMEGVKKGDMSLDEALRFVRDFLDAQVQQENP